MHFTTTKNDFANINLFITSTVHHLNPYANYHPHRWTPYIDSIRNASYQVNLSALITSPDTVASELKTAIGVAFQPNSDKGKKTPVVKHR